MRHLVTDAAFEKLVSALSVARDGPHFAAALVGQAQRNQAPHVARRANHLKNAAGSDDKAS